MNVADVGEARDVVEARVDLVAAEAEDRGVEIDVLAPGELRVEAGAELEQRGDAAVDLDRARGGLQRAADDLQQRRLARAVAADDADRLAAPHLERDAVQRREIAVVAASARARRAAAGAAPPSASGGPRAARTSGSASRRRERGWRIVRGHRRTPCASSGTTR